MNKLFAKGVFKYKTVKIYEPVKVTL